MSNNVGIAIGPAVGGYTSTTSYHIAFICAAAGLVGYSLLLLLFAKETLPENLIMVSKIKNIFNGYGQILHNKPFRLLVISITLGQMAVVPIWVLMSVYAKNEYGIPENQFGLIATTNALLVVLLQLPITRRTKSFPPNLVITSGVMIYSLSSCAVSFATGFWGFWLCMVIMTIGELFLVPTASTTAASLAPVDKRGHYMSIFGLSWGVASGVSSPVGGLLSDTFEPRFIWFGSGMVGV